MEDRFRFAVRKGTSNYGIEDIRQLKDLVATGKVEATDYVFTYKTREWKRVGDHPELRSFFPGFTSALRARENLPPLSAPFPISPKSRATTLAAGGPPKEGKATPRAPARKSPSPRGAPRPIPPARACPCLRPIQPAVAATPRFGQLQQLQPPAHAGFFLCGLRFWRDAQHLFGRPPTIPPPCAPRP